MCLFQARFSLSVQHLRQRFPQGTGSLLSPLARVPSGVLASVALCLASDYVHDRPLSLESTPTRMLCFVPLVLGMGQLLVVWGSLRVKLRWFGPPLSTRALLLSPRFCLFQNV